MKKVENTTAVKETKEDALKRHKQSLKNHIDSLNKKNYQGIKDLKTLDTIIMFCPNEKALELPDKGGQKLMEYALSKKVTLCGPSMLFLIFTGSKNSSVISLE